LFTIQFTGRKFLAINSRNLSLEKSSRCLTFASFCDSCQDWNFTSPLTLSISRIGVFFCFLRSHQSNLNFESWISSFDLDIFWNWSSNKTTANPLELKIKAQAKFCFLFQHFVSWKLFCLQRINRKPVLLVGCKVQKPVCMPYNLTSENPRMSFSKNRSFFCSSVIWLFWKFYWREILRGETRWRKQCSP